MIHVDAQLSVGVLVCVGVCAFVCLVSRIRIIFTALCGLH